MIAFSRQAPKRPEQIGMYGAEVGSPEAGANRSSGCCTVDFVWFQGGRSSSCHRGALRRGLAPRTRVSGAAR
eukprot:9973976-Prorocentrum_lima.AAC.1